ncbi:DNA translocase FtsK [Alicyclobacillus fastidiosus]|uniref:DNA translocase FtsK n=1 Tax=Alicyclobacillus fastidiosus TaxID=392011 RepID=A0ABY6ZMI3_9BACL|nr:DNA translocase FtsK [Alicyclobacillus fastidiosus]WAH43401.1 DNA translocase FtsK [Alicyclobacillus fastidiosus]
MDNKADEIVKTAAQIEGTMQIYGVNVKVVEAERAKDHVRYFVRPSSGVKVARMLELKDDLSLVIAARQIQMEPVPEKSCVAVDVYSVEKHIWLDREEIPRSEYLPQNAAKIQKNIDSLATTRAIFSHELDEWDYSFTLIREAVKQGYEVRIKKVQDRDSEHVDIKLFDLRKSPMDWFE